MVWIGKDDNEFMTEKTQAEKWAVLAQAAHIRASRPCTGGDYEQLKTRLKLCGMTGAEYEDAVRELREALDMV